MIYDLIIRGGTVIDPDKETEEIRDIYVYQGKIMPQPAGSEEQSKTKKTLDAQNCYVFPGLIENHTHVFYIGTESGIDPDLTLIPNGVTSAIDQGSSGSATFEALYRNVIRQSCIDIKAYLNVACTGIITEKYMENIDPRYFDEAAITGLFQKYSDTLVGLKIRLGLESCRGLKLRPLEKTIELAERLGRPVSVHVKDPFVPVPEIAKLLRKDDIWVHMYQVGERTILNDNGEVYPELFAAKERGVLFDVASGRGSFSFDLVKTALGQGFKPDFLGTDLVRFNMYERPLFSLLYTMSMYLSLGFSLSDVVKKCTVLPARAMKMSERVGLLRPGFQADIVIVKAKEGSITFRDRHGGVHFGNELLIPQATVKSGELLYRNMEF